VHFTFLYLLTYFYLTPIGLNSEVEGNYRSRGKWYPGVVTKIDNGVYDVLYIDGEKEEGMGIERIRLTG
jgi:hypothetical protein